MDQGWTSNPNATHVWYPNEILASVWHGSSFSTPQMDIFLAGLPNCTHFSLVQDVSINISTNIQPSPNEILTIEVSLQIDISPSISNFHMSVFAPMISKLHYD